MIILTNGFKLPETGDFGDVWFPALEFNIQQLNDHTHNGTDSEQLDSTAIAPLSVTVLSGSFVDQGDGYWRALATVPSGGLVDNYPAIVRDPTTKEQILAKTEKFSATQVYIYLNVVQTVEVQFVV